MTAPSPGFLLIDVSNAFTKHCVADKRKMGVIHKLPTANITAAWIKKLVQKTKAETIYLSSVVPSVTQIFQKATHTRTSLEILKGTGRLPIAVHYPKPDKIGADRLANAIGAYTQYSAPCVVIDFGTAVTFDVIDSTGAYAGGVIAPGLNVMTEYLHEKTALLPLVKLQEPKRAIAKSTEEAIRAGAFYGYRGMIVEILKKIERELGTRSLKTIATGGQAEIVLKKIDRKIRIDASLTLYGLWMWAQFLRAQSINKPVANKNPGY
jgi:type III pantothenate kinase